MNALSESWKAIDALIPDRDSIVAATAKGLIFGYDRKWAESGWVCEAVEKPFELPIVNPDSERSSRTFTQAGKMDKLASYSGKRFLVEHKTTSDDLSDPNGSYFRRLDIDHQVSQYMLAAWQEGDKLEGTLYDVVRKPGIRPRKITKEEIRELNATGLYHGFAVSEGVYEAGHQEDAALYQRRLSRETIEQPERYFARKTLYRIDAQILDFARELWDTADEIRLARLNNRHYKNPAACVAYGTPCEYLPLCSGHDTPESDRWVKRESVHEELELSETGLNVLTHSRIQCFRTCRKKHFYRYEEGLRRASREESDALYFGHVFHHALAAWWSCFLPEGVHANGNANGSPVNEAGEHSTASEAHVAR